MDLSQLTSILNSASYAATWLTALGVSPTAPAHQNLVRIAQTGMSPDLLSSLLSHLEQSLPALCDRNLALDGLTRFIESSRNPQALGGSFERDPELLRILLQLFAVSATLADALIEDPGALELIRLTQGQPVDADKLMGEIRAEVAKSSGINAATATLHRYQRREMLRIAYTDLIHQSPVDLVMQQLSSLADALCEAALCYARQQLIDQRGVPKRADGQPAQCAVIALEQLGGQELSYTRDVELVFVYDEEGQTDGEPKPWSNAEFFGQLRTSLLKLLTGSASQRSGKPSETPTGREPIFRVTTRFQPSSDHNRLTMGRDDLLRYYDVMGNSSDRQAFVKARAIAGSRDLGGEFLSAMQSWVYRRYLSRIDIAGIRALKRRIERRALRERVREDNIESCRGGIRDIEFVTQFLQLLSGGNFIQLRTSNTLHAIQRLQAADCLSSDEAKSLSEAYRFLRRLEHRLQLINAPGEPPLIPSDANQLDKLGRLMSKQGGADAPPTEVVTEQLNHCLSRSRKTLDRLLHDAFDGEDADEEPGTDLVLDPDPPTDFINATLAPYGFRDIPRAYQNLVALAGEKIQFLSTRRCRHFLAAIAPSLLEAIQGTPNPDQSLEQLAEVSDSLGGKGVLWQLFHVHPATLQLYVRLCASSPYLTSILMRNPGMLDELMDSLALRNFPSRDVLQAMLDDWCRGADDIARVLHSFKNAQHLNAGVRDILGKVDIHQTTGFLADVADVCLNRICDTQLAKMIDRFGEPWNDAAQRRCDVVVVALGKFGDREPNYHSDLDVIFLYECEGTTRDPRRGQPTSRSTSHQHFFNELAQRVTKSANQLGPYGRLYELDASRLAIGETGKLARSLESFFGDLDTSTNQLVERLAFCRARVVSGHADAQRATQQRIQQLLCRPWNPHDEAQIRDFRATLEQHASPRNLKRAPGGLVDIELLVQMYQLKFAASHPQILVTGVTAGLARLRQHQLIEAEDADRLSKAYTQLRAIEARLRLMNRSLRDDLPADPQELAKLDYLLAQPDNEPAATQALATMREVRQIFDRLCQHDGPSAS